MYNVCSPNPITNRLFQNLLRKKMKIPFGLNLPKMVLNLGAIIMGTETELLLKSRKVFPEKLLKLGFNFQTVSFNEFKI